jgi:hypothetical protein
VGATLVHWLVAAPVMIVSYAVILVLGLVSRRFRSDVVLAGDALVEVGAIVTWPPPRVPAISSSIPQTFAGRIGVPYAKQAISAAQMKVVA